jgi:hypothetical protein
MNPLSVEESYLTPVHATYAPTLAQLEYGPFLTKPVDEKVHALRRKPLGDA